MIFQHIKFNQIEYFEPHSTEQLQMKDLLFNEAFAFNHKFGKQHF